MRRCSDAAPRRAVASRPRDLAASLHLRVEASARLAARVVRGASEAPQGWVSRRYGEKQPAPVIETRMVSSAPASLITLLAPSSETRRATLGVAAQSLPVRTLADERTLESDTRRATAVALAIPHARGEDLVILSSRGALVEAGPCRVRAEALWLRLEDDRPTRLLALDATYVEVARRRLLEQDRQPVAPSAQSVNHFWSARLSAAAPAIVEERKHVRYSGDR